MSEVAKYTTKVCIHAHINV